MFVRSFDVKLCSLTSSILFNRASFLFCFKRSSFFVSFFSYLLFCFFVSLLCLLYFFFLVFFPHVYFHVKKVMPDVMTPESMVSKLDTFENLKEGDQETTQEERDVSNRPTAVHGVLCSLLSFSVTLHSSVV